MFLEIILLSLIIVKLSGGSWDNLIRLKIKKMGLIYWLLGIQLLGMVLYYRTNLFQTGQMSYLNLVFYLLYIILLVYNIDLDGSRLLILGLALNLLPMIFNRGRMPVKLEALESLGLYQEVDLLFQDQALSHSLMGPDTRFKLLGDILPMGKSYGLPKVISLGDIVIGLGIFIFIYRASRKVKED